MKWSTVLFGLWALGLVVGSFSLIVRLRRLTRMIRIARPINDPEIERVARQVAVGLGLFGLPDVLVSHSGSGPLAAWLGRPVILLPESALASLPAAELRMALAHETAHFQRHDIWTAFVPTLSQLLFFFFPPAWIAAREFSIAREQACDAAAIRLCGAAPADYGLFLLRFVSVPSVRIAALGSTPTYRTLERRMKMLPYVPVSRPRRGAIPVMALVSIVALIPFKLAAQDVAGARKSDKPVIAAQAPTSHPSADTAPAVAQEAAAAPKPAQPVKAVGRRGTDVKPVRAQAPATLAAVPAPTAVVGSADNVQGIAAPVSQSPAADIARAAPAPLVKPIDAAIEAQNLTPAPQAGSTHAATQPTTPIYGVTLSPPAQNRVQARPSNGIYLSRAARNGVPMTPTAGTPPQELTIRASQARTRNRGQSADIVADMQKAVVQRLPNGQVSLEMDGANLLRALKELFRAADADFKIDQEAAEIAGRTRVFMQLRSASVGKALDLLLSAGRGSDSRLSYRVEGGVYIVIPSDGPRRR